MKKVFGFKQNVTGITPICTCCNIIVAGGAKKKTVDEHILHDDCAEKLSIITGIKEEMKVVIAGLPQDLFTGTNILEQLDKAYTIGAFKLAVHMFCRHLSGAKSWLKERFKTAVAALKSIVERCRIRVVLEPALAF